jgi:fucose 4-O-acetylase-like acetyltransferase
MRTLLSDKYCLFHCNSVVALYFAAVTTLSAFAGQNVAGKVVKKLGRASLIIFILAFTIFVSSLTLGMYHSYIPFLSCPRQDMGIFVYIIMLVYDSKQVELA